MIILKEGEFCSC